MRELRIKVKPTARRGHRSWTGGGRCARNGQDYQAKGLLLQNPGIRARSRQITFSGRVLEAVKIFMPCRKRLTYGERPSNDRTLTVDDFAGHSSLSDALNGVRERSLKLFIFLPENLIKRRGIQSIWINRMGYFKP
jgi:hypothetical protein